MSRRRPNKTAEKEKSLMAIRTIRRLFGWTDVLDSLFYGRSVLPNIFIRHYLITNVWYKSLLWLEKRNTPAKNVFLGCFLLSICATLIGLNKFVFTDNPYRFLEDLFYTPSLYFLYLGFKDPFFNENT